MKPQCLWAMLLVSLADAQSPRPSDWLSAGGDAQRSGVEKNDPDITKAGVRKFQPVLQRKLGKGELLNAPVIIGRLISHKGFKELAIVTSVLGHVWAIDVDLDLVFWERQLPAGKVPSCGLTPMPAMMPAPETGPGRNLLRAVFVLASDGMLYRLNPATGEDAGPPLPFLAPNANASSLIADNSTGKELVRASTRAACRVAAANWTIDMNSGFVDKTAYSADAFAPVTQVRANGVVFAFAGRALVAHDTETGAELFSSGNRLTSPPSGTGLSLANGRVYVTTEDGTLWAFGVPVER